MPTVAQVIDEFPKELRTPVKHLYEVLKDEGWVSHEDFSGLKGVVSDLAEAQARTEDKVEELAEAQRRTEDRVEELAEAQKRTELRVEELAAVMERGFKSLRDSIAALGSRWGIMSEETFRKAVRGILEETGYSVERGYYGEREVDVVIRNGSRIILELTSALKAGDIPKILASAADYEARNGTKASIMVAAIFIPPSAMRVLLDAPRKIDLFTYEEEL